LIKPLEIEKLKMTNKIVIIIACDNFICQEHILKKFYIDLTQHAFYTLHSPYILDT
jgi:hypothetical protein